MIRETPIMEARKIVEPGTVALAAEKPPRMKLGNCTISFKEWKKK